MEHTYYQDSSVSIVTEQFREDSHRRVQTLTQLSIIGMQVWPFILVVTFIGQVVCNIMLKMHYYFIIALNKTVFFKCVVFYYVTVAVNIKYD